MPKKKKQVKNGFYWYMQDLIPELRREGHHIKGIADAVPLAHPRWKALAPENKEIYEEKAKVEKRKESAKPGASNSHTLRDTRLDNVGQLIASRVSPEEAALKRRAKESRISKSRWANGDNAAEEMLDYQFYFIAFEYLCEMEENDVKSYYPMEVGIIEYSMRNGITKRFHRHIKPAPIPLGYRYECMHHSEETHQIPVEGHEEGEGNYLGLYLQLENFINPSGVKKEYPAIHTLGTHLECAESCLQWIHQMAWNQGLGHPSRLQKVFELENMVVDLVQLAGEHTISRPAILDVLSSCAWDYEPNTRCAFHEEMGNKFCALYSCQNWAYLLSDFLADIYKIVLVPGRHQPEPAESDIVAIPPMPQLDQRPPPRSQPRSQSQQSYTYAPSKSSASYSSLVKDGSNAFGARDIRDGQESFVVYTGPTESDEDTDSDTDLDSVLEAEMSQSETNHSQAGIGRGSVLPPEVYGRRNAPAPSVDNDEDFPALGAPGPAKPRQRQQQQQPMHSYARPPSSLASSTTSVPPQSSISSAASIVSSKFESDEETFESDVLSRPATTKKRDLHQAVKEKELAQKMRQSKAKNVGPAGEPVNQALPFQPSGPLGRGSAPRAVNAVSSGFKPSLGGVNPAANVGQGRGVKLSSGNAGPPVGRGRGQSSSGTSTPILGQQDSRAVPRQINSNKTGWAGVGRGFGVTPSQSEASSVVSGFAKSSVVADDTESLASSAVTQSSMSTAGRGRGIWQQRPRPVQPPPGFGLGNTLAERMKQQMNMKDGQYVDAESS